MKKALVEKKYLATFVLITSLFFMWGFAHAILDVLNKHFQEVLEMTKTRSALVQVMLYTGYFTMAIPAGLFISRRGYRAGVVVGLLLYGIGSLLFNGAGGVPLALPRAGCCTASSCPRRWATCSRASC